uniref:Uncharacterized protein n=1 Tax=Brassica oleracea TaxID=3712 RepID=A0A3P6AUV4_BRAOL|nr:unnamed protein product [Brassica oleracea]
MRRIFPSHLISHTSPSPTNSSPPLTLSSSITQSFTLSLLIDPPQTRETMKDISKSPARRNNDGFHRYLKPGALAQIRNSRINSRSASLLSLSPSPLPIDPPSPSAANNLTLEQVPHLLRKIYGPYSYQRKKLGAARPMTMMMMANLNNPIIESSGGSGSDVIAH